MIERFNLYGAVVALSLLSGCGAGNSDEAAVQGAPVAQPQLLAARSATVSGAAAAIGDNASVLLPDQASSLETNGEPTRYEANMNLPRAARLLAQASMGGSMYDIEYVAKKGINNWVVEQSRIPQSFHRAYISYVMGGNSLDNGGTEDQFYESFWKQVCTGRDQLRQRVAFGLSQIFVVSFQDDYLSGAGRMMASYYDVLGTHAFGNFRNLLKDVATHPAMAIYLSYLHNMKETENTVPDENFARELMQLMTIGLYELNQDGTQKLVNGKPVETYSSADVKGLAKVFTGWSWYGPDRSDARYYGSVKDPNRDWKPLQAYPAFHSTSAKQVLGKPLPSGTPEQELDAALDRLFNHPNVGPFIGKQLIQRMVTSNPSPAYVKRVAAAFNDNGWGVRGDMLAVIKAILYDQEARSDTHSANFGRVREPILREANWMRAFYAKSVSGNYMMWRMDDPLTGFGQAMLRAPSVFNFYRPTYAPPGTPVEAEELVAPEMQIASEPAVVGYLNTLQNMVYNGIGKAYDVRTAYRNERALVRDPERLVDRLNLLFMSGAMSPTLRQQMLTAIRSMPLETPNATNAVAVEYQTTNRIYIAAYLAMATPEYIVQK